MAGKSENWEPISADELRVGHYIKIDHHWLAHSFARNVFQISREQEIETIRNTGLTRLYVDLARSVLGQVGAAVDADEVLPEQSQPEAEQEVAAPATAPLGAEAEAGGADQVREHRAALERIGARYSATIGQTRSLLSLLNAASTDVKEDMDLLVAANVDALLSGSTPLAMVDIDAPLNSAQRNVLLGIDAVGICGVLGKQMGLAERELRTLSHAASLHLIGLLRLPSELAEETPEGGQVLSPLFRRYPEVSARMIVECGGFPPEVIRVVREHRELPDGSGFPDGLKDRQIHPLALILGAVRAYQVLCAGTDSEPAQALAHMYRDLRTVYGDEIILNLITALTVYPPGSFLQLSDGSIGRVLRVNEGHRMRPVVGVINQDLDVGNTRIVDLSREEELHVVRLVNLPLLPLKILEQCRAKWAGMAIAR